MGLQQHLLSGKIEYAKIATAVTVFMVECIPLL
jgi:Flp pilus assembly pilin Flp